MSDLNVGLSVDVLEDLLKAPEAALHHAEDGLGHPPRLALQLLLDVGQNGPRQLDQGDDESTKSQGTRVEPATWLITSSKPSLTPDTALVVFFGLH